MEGEEIESTLPFITLTHVSHTSCDDDYIRSVNDTCMRILQTICAGQSRCDLDTNFPTCVDYVIHNCLRNSSHCDTQAVTECMTNCFRVCRNLCALSSAHQDVLSSEGSVINSTCQAISSGLEKCVKSDTDLVLKRCAVQFLGNYASGKRQNQLEVWHKLQTLFLKLLQVCDEKLQEYVLIVLHICLGDLATSLEAPLPEDPCWPLVKGVITYAVEHDSANGLLVVEDILKMTGFCEQVYGDLDNQSKLLVLEVLINSLKRLPEETEALVEEEDREVSPAVHNLHFIAAHFIQHSNTIPTFTATDSSMFEHEALCTVKELEVLCLATAHHNRYNKLQDNPDLVSAAVGLLQAVQELGRQGNNVFTNVEKMSQQREVNPDHPVFGLKRDLIRLLGNLAYRHKENQDMVRELEGLPLIMEQTNIDGKNPFITQWSVFALHNLTENNEDNRLYIANLKLEGIANNQSVLEEMGLTAETEGDKVVIKKRKTDR